MASLEEDIKDKLTKVCICKAIEQDKIKESIRKGANTLETVAEATGATTGACKGSRCKEKIEQLLEQYEKGEWA